METPFTRCGEDEILTIKSTVAPYRMSSTGLTTLILVSLHLRDPITTIFQQIWKRTATQHLRYPKCCLCNASEEGAVLSYALDQLIKHIFYQCKSVIRGKTRSNHQHWFLLYFFGQKKCICSEWNRIDHTISMKSIQCWIKLTAAATLINSLSWRVN